MFSKLFEERDKTITHLVKLGDCVARSLRENVSLFAIDSNNSQVSYLTESGKVISGKYSMDKDVKLNNIKVQDASVFEDGDQLDSFVNEKIHSFVESIHYGEYSSADDSFSDVLSLWENRLKLSTVQAKLYEQSSRLAAVEKIIETAEFQKVVEVSPQLQEFLKENFDKVTNVPEVRNAINLSNAVSNAFNFPKLTLEELETSKSYTLKDGIEPSIYDMVCRQELVKRELIESKRSFDTIWADNASIQKLASLVFGSDEEVVTALSEALKEIPYLALASKKSLFSTFSNCLGHSNGVGVSDKDIQGFSSRIFEYKKDVKKVFIESINEKYGVNIQNLQNPASFKSLANTQVVIFEALTRLAPKGSIIKDTLSDLSKMLKSKNGVEVIDVNDVIQECFEQCGYDSFCDDFRLVENLSFDTILDEEMSVVELLEKAKLHKEKLLMDKAKKKGDKDALSPEQAKAKKDCHSAEDADTGDEDLEDDSVRAAEAASPMSKPAPFSTDGGGGDDGEEEEKPKESSSLAIQKGVPDDGLDKYAGKKKTKKKKANEEAEPEAEAPTADPEGGEESPEKEEPMSQQDFLKTLKDMDELLKGMSPEEEEDEVDSAEDDETEA